MNILRDVRVLDLAGPQGIMCTKLLADMGADVVRVEPPGGDPLRHAYPYANSENERESLFFWYFNTNKRSVVLDLTDKKDQEMFIHLVINADVLVESFPTSLWSSIGLAKNTLCRTNPGLIQVSVTDFGQTGPLSRCHGSDIVCWAMGGLMYPTGYPNREPLTVPEMQAYQVAGLWSTIAVLALLLRRLRTGQGGYIEIAAHEVVTDISELVHLSYICERKNLTRKGPVHPAGPLLSAFETSDKKYVSICAYSRQQWSSLVEWMNETISVEFLKDQGLLFYPERMRRWQEINNVVSRWVQQFTLDELLQRTLKMNFPLDPVRHPSEWIKDEHTSFRRFFVKVDDPRGPNKGEKHLYPGIPFRYAGQGPFREVSTPAPRIGEGTDEVLRQWSSKRGKGTSLTESELQLPLAGLKVLELAWVVSGPTVGRILGDFGATVLKVEPREIGDPMRIVTQFYGPPTINNGANFQDLGRGKLSMTLDIKKSAARDIIINLARWADVIIENFTPGTMERLGLSYDVLSEVNPRLIMGSLSGYGMSGPYHDRVCYNPIAVAFSGIMSLYSYEDTYAPFQAAHSHTDYYGAFMQTVGILHALLRRQKMGEGAHVETSLIESCLALLGPQILQWVVNGEKAKPMGNRAGSLGAILQGCYRCLGEDNWLVVTIPDEATLSKLAQFLDGELGSKLVAPEEVETALRSWLKGAERWAAFRTLQELGVAAGVVCTGEDLIEREGQIFGEKMFVNLVHPEAGPVKIVRSPVLLDGSPLPITRPAPLLGEHNEYVAKQILGMSEEQYLQLVTTGVI